MFTVKKGDITKEVCDAMVNPANSKGEMGGGVALAIKRAGGNEIEKEAISKSPISIGSAVATTAGKLNCKYVIHAPTMKKTSERIRIENVRRATRAALELASGLGIKSIAFPGMGTGTGGVDFDTAAKTMIDEMKKFKNFDIILIGNKGELVDAFKKNLKNR